MFSQYFYPIVSSFPNPEEEDVVVTVVVSEIIPPPLPPSEPPTELEVFLTVFLIFFTLVLAVVSDMVVYNFIKPSEMITQSGGLGSLNGPIKVDQKFSFSNFSVSVHYPNLETPEIWVRT